VKPAALRNLAAALLTLGGACVLGGVATAGTPDAAPESPSAHLSDAAVSPDAGVTFGRLSDRASFVAAGFVGVRAVAGVTFARTRHGAGGTSCAFAAAPSGPS
jgi:hypothetical protein